MNSTKTATLDNFDLKILKIMQQSNRVPSDRIAEQIGLSPAAVQRRIKRMREQNVIQADISVVNPQAVGLGVTIIVEVTLERERSDLLDFFKKEMMGNPAVQQCFYVTGSADFILVVTAIDMDDYESFTRDVFFENHNVRNFQSNVVMTHVKKGLTVPVNLEDKLYIVAG
jgi:Lrp/AsnC family leucine-responsive transcriptional regulator